jgi:hypothetical protein
MQPILPYVTLFTDLMSAASALVPLFEQHAASGKEPTDDDVRQALAGKDAAMAALDLMIAQRQAQERAAVHAQAGPAP